MYKNTCNLCGKEHTYSNKYHYNRANKETTYLCRSCKRKELNKQQPSKIGPNNPAWKGYELIPYSWFSKYFLRSNRKRKGAITIEDVWTLYLQQNKCCRLSGLPIGFNDDGNGHTASIDRIDSSGEYTLDNIQLVHKDINLMKNHFNQDYFIMVCKLVANNGR